MYDFFVGLGFGVICSMFFSKKKKTKDRSTQVETVPVSAPVEIPVPRRSFIPGAFANFWGKDS
jgi:hypothetical protein